MQRVIRLAGPLFLACALAASAAPKPYAITVFADDTMRHQSPVYFQLPKEAGTAYSLMDDAGGYHDLQVQPDGRACFIQDSLRQRDKRGYKLVQRVATGSGNERLVSAVTPKPGIIEINIAGRPVLRYQGVKSPLPRDDIKEILQRGAYIHPLYSPSGKLVTDDYPPNHLHHHGIWFAWTKTEFEGRTPDFWNMGEGKGTVEFVDAAQSWSGPVHAGFRGKHRFVDLTSGEPKTVLEESWEVTAYWIGRSGGEFWMIDLVSTQQCATAASLKLPEYYYGGIGLRGNRSWDGKNNAFFLTSEGEKDRVKGNTTRGRWCDMSGYVDGKLAGVAVLGHPGNFRAPQPMRLHPDEPFFCYTPQQMGEMEITPEKPYVSRYRFIVHDGPPVAARLDQFYNDYAHPASVKIDYSPE